MATNEQINVEINAKYDDTGAKAATTDLDKLDGREVTAEATIDVDDNATRVVDGVDTALDGIDGRDVEATVDVDDDATRVVDGVDTALDGIDGRDVEATVGVDDNASRIIDDVDGKLDKLDGRPVSATVDADKGAGLTAVEGDLKEIDGNTYRATVDASTGKGLTAAEGDLKEIDGNTYKATVDADEGAGLTGVRGTLTSMSTAVGASITGINSMTGPTGLLAVLGGAFLTAANQAGEIALEAQSIASFTGTSIDEASALADVLRTNTSIEADEVLDLIAQMAGVLAATPGLATQFGTTLDEVRTNPLAAFVSIIDKIGADGKMSFDEMLAASQIFGEEGVRQVNEIITRLGPGGLRGAMEAVPEARLISQQDVDNALEMKRRFADLGAQMQGMAVTVGSEVVPVLADMLGQLEDAGGLLNEIASGGQEGTARSVWDWINEFPSEKFTEIYDSLVAAGVSAEDFRENMFDLADVQALLGAGIPPEVIESAELTADAQAYLTEQITATEEAAVAEEQALLGLGETTTTAADAIDALIDSLEEERDAHRDAADAAEEQTDALLAANDVFYAQRKAVRDAEKAQHNYDEVVGDATSSAEDQQAALDEVTEAFADVADANVETARQQAAARGESLSHTEALDIQNQSLLAQASTLQGAEREALEAHIARLNGIPTEVVSEILALIEEGKIEEAERLLNETSRTREATYQADVENASAAATEEELNQIARDREAWITVRARQGYDSSVFGPAGTPQTAAATASMPAGAGWAMAGGGDTYNLNLPRGTRLTDTVRALDRHARRNGRRAYAFR